MRFRSVLYSSLTLGPYPIVLPHARSVGELRRDDPRGPPSSARIEVGTPHDEYRYIYRYIYLRADHTNTTTCGSYSHGNNRSRLGVGDRTRNVTGINPSPSGRDRMVVNGGFSRDRGPPSCQRSLSEEKKQQFRIIDFIAM